MTCGSGRQAVVLKFWIITGAGCPMQLFMQQATNAADLQATPEQLANLRGMAQARLLEQQTVDVDGKKVAWSWSALQLHPEYLTTCMKGRA